MHSQTGLLSPNPPSTQGTGGCLGVFSGDCCKKFKFLEAMYDHNLSRGYLGCLGEIEYKKFTGFESLEQFPNSEFLNIPILLTSIPDYLQCCPLRMSMIGPLLFWHCNEKFRTFSGVLLSSLINNVSKNFNINV